MEELRNKLLKSIELNGRKSKEMYDHSKGLKEVAELIKDKAYRENKSPADILSNICEVMSNGN